MSRTENRRSARTKVTMAVNHRCGGKAATSRATNLSHGGLQVQLPDDSVKRGDRLRLEFMLPRTDVRIRAKADVVYQANSRAGVRFTYVPSTMKRLLDAYVSARLAGVLID